MDKLALAMLKRGDIAGLLAQNKTLYGDATMTGPAGDPTGQTVVLPPAPPPPPPAAPAVTTISEEEVNKRIEAARQQEKDKLYATLEEERIRREALEERVNAFSTDLQTRQQAEEEAKRAAEQAAEEKRLAELSFGEKLAEFQNQTSQQLSGLQEQLAQRDLLLEKERQYTELMQYRATALTNENPEGPGRGLGPTIMPQLRDFVQGNSPEEIEASISALSERSTAILSDVAQATGAQRQQARGVGVTAPPVGPMDNNSGHQTVTADEIRDMDMNTYAANRSRLLGAASQQQQGRGMFG